MPDTAAACLHAMRQFEPTPSRLASSHEHHYGPDLRNVSAEMVCRLAVWLSTQPNPRTELRGYVVPDGDVDALGMELVSVSRRYLAAGSTSAYRTADWGARIAALAASLAA
jgi:hypothetical protein